MPGSEGRGEGAARKAQGAAREAQGAPAAGDAPRIWLALDALDRSEAPLGAAFALARVLRAELAALFVENADLFRLAAFPQAFETRLFGPAGQAPVESEALEDALRAQASALQRQLQRVAREAGVNWSFRIARGRIVQQALEVAEAADCVVLPSAGIATSIGLRPTLARPRGAQRTAAPAIAPGRQIWALPGAGPAGQRVLEIGHRLLGGAAPGRLVLPDDPARAAALRDWLRQQGWRDDWREASLEELLAARQRAAGGGTGLLLLPRPTDSADRERLERGLRRAGWPIVMV